MRRLFRRREIVLPTLWGAIAILFAGAAAAVLFAANLHSFLAVNQPVGAKVLVVEGWMNHRGLGQAVTVFRDGRYERVVTTGGPIDQWPASVYGTYAELAADYLKRHGVAEAEISVVPSPPVGRERTYRSAVLVRDWAKRAGYAAEPIDVFSLGTHARRSRLLYRMAFGPDAAIGVHAARAFNYDGDEWWRTSAGARDVLDQAIGLLWVKCCFWPSPSE